MSVPPRASSRPPGVGGGPAGEVAGCAAASSHAGRSPAGCRTRGVLPRGQLTYPITDPTSPPERRAASRPDTVPASTPRSVSLLTLISHFDVCRMKIDLRVVAESLQFFQGGFNLIEENREAIHGSAIVGEVWRDGHLGAPRWTTARPAQAAPPPSIGGAHVASSGPDAARPSAPPTGCSRCVRRCGAWTSTASSTTIYGRAPLLRPLLSLIRKISAPKMWKS
jgi:hypothetical protein